MKSRRLARENSFEDPNALSSLRSPPSGRHLGTQTPQTVFPRPFPRRSSGECSRRWRKLVKAEGHPDELRRLRVPALDGNPAQYPAFSLPAARTDSEPLSSCECDSVCCRSKRRPAVLQPPANEAAHGRSLPRSGDSRSYLRSFRAAPR